MKYLALAICAFMILAACDNTQTQENEENSPTDLFNEIMEENEVIKTDFEEKDPPIEGSVKDQLLGIWYSETSDIEIHLSKDRYISYVDGRKNWDEGWEIVSSSDLSDEAIDNDGNYLHVISDDDGATFYCLEIISLDEEKFHGLVAGSTGDGPYDHVYWSRENLYTPEESADEIDLGW